MGSLEGYLISQGEFLEIKRDRHRYLLIKGVSTKSHPRWGGGFWRKEEDLHW